nr:transposase [Nocardia donostiensis]
MISGRVREVGARCRVGPVHPHVGGEAHRYGRGFRKVDRWFPSTQRCSVCGAVGGKKPLHVREWACTCGASHDHDANAAKNILAAGRAERLNACGETVSPAA